MSAITLAAQAVALDALAQLGAAMGHLPGAHISLSDITPNQLDISLHDDLGDFETWRSALGIAADTVTYIARTRHTVLKAHATFAGATIELCGYAALLPQPESGAEA
ncbi:hypothetical protein [Streptomyces youssoufiensis]